MKAVVFAYHDMGCLGVQAVLDAGYDIAAIFTHADNPGENAFLDPFLAWRLTQGSRSMPPMTSIIRSGPSASVNSLPTLFSLSTIAICFAMRFWRWHRQARSICTVRYCRNIAVAPR